MAHLRIGGCGGRVEESTQEEFNGGNRTHKVSIRPLPFQFAKQNLAFFVRCVCQRHHIGLRDGDESDSQPDRELTLEENDDGASFLLGHIFH